MPNVSPEEADSRRGEELEKKRGERETERERGKSEGESRKEGRWEDEGIKICFVFLSGRSHSNGT